MICLMAGVAGAAPVYITNDTALVWTDVTAGGSSAQTLTANNRMDEPSLYNGVLYAPSGNPWTVEFVNVTTNVAGTTSLGWPNRVWTAEHTATGEYMGLKDDQSVSNPVGRWANPDATGTLVKSAAGGEQGYYLGADSETFNGHLYYTTTSGNSNGNKVWELPLGFTAADAPVAFFTFGTSGNGKGICFDGAGYMYYAIDSTVLKVKLSDMSSTTFLSQEVYDIDFLNNELYLSTGSAVDVYNMAGVFQRTIGQGSSAKYTEFGPEPPIAEPAGLGLLGVTLLAVRKRRS